MTIAAYALLFLAGLGFGHGAGGVWKWLPLAFPLLLALVAALRRASTAHSWSGSWWRCR